nr:phage holin family protein [Rhodoferax sp.]
METAQDSGSAWGAVQHKATTLLEVVHTRMELLGNELQVARATILRQLLLAQALLFCVGIGLILTTIGLTILFWEQRLVVVWMATAVAWLAALCIYILLRGNKEHAEPLFNASLAELKEDLRQLKAASAQDHGRKTR